ncbi:MAG: hypothetical protein HYY01_12300 [Chloroflexi bacterium]|nr:hypothetical protein [Chloroflexota bacterium]
MRSAIAIRQIIGFRAFLVAASLSVLGLSIWYWAGSGGRDGQLAYQGGYRGSSGPMLEEFDFGGLPFPWAERVGSVAEAQARLSFAIPLPSDLTGEWEPVEIWAPEAGRPSRANEHVKVTFVNGVDLAVGTGGGASIKTVVQDSGGKRALVKVGQYDAMVGERNTAVVHGQDLELPSEVTWRQHGTLVNLYSKAHSAGELLEMAPLFVRAPSGEQEPEPAKDGGIPVPPPPPDSPPPSAQP